MTIHIDKALALLNAYLANREKKLQRRIGPENPVRQAIEELEKAKQDQPS